MAQTDLGSYRKLVMHVSLMHKSLIIRHHEFLDSLSVGLGSLYSVV